VYIGDRQGGEPRRVTDEPFDVIELLPPPSADDCLYFLASPENATQRYLFRKELSDGALRRVTPDDQPGTHRYQLSGDGRWAIHEYSSFGSPPTIELVSLPDHRTVRNLVSNRRMRQQLEALDRPASEFLQVDIGDGVVLDGWCIRPSRIKPGKKYPLLVHVYGEPAGQSVVDSWGGFNYLWHSMLAQQGYVVMSFDNRGTPAPKGRGWRKYVYRKIGILAPQDQAAAVRQVLAERSYLDAERVGVWGWSGGGSMSLNAIFKYPDLYKTAIAVAPVPNQQYYDTIYQERYMGLPETNVDGYRDGSPIHFAKQLTGNLLLVHGTGDDNCHYQTMELLINELVQQNKRFTMMAYPYRTHAIREGKNTTRHLRDLMTWYLQNNLPAGPR
jgi:dipeptidyl-peptidase-4